MNHFFGSFFQIILLGIFPIIFQRIAALTQQTALAIVGCVHQQTNMLIELDSSIAFAISGQV